MSAVADLRSRLQRRPALRRWGLLLLMLAVIWLLMLWWLAAERERVYARETELLQAQARTLDSLISQQLGSIHQALDAVLAQYPRWHQKDLQSEAEPLLSNLVKAMPGIRVLSIVDANGRMQASSSPQIVGVDASQREFYLRPKLQPARDRLYVSQPFTSVLGAYTMSLSQALLDEQGRFLGAVVISLEPAYFRLMLDVTRTAPETWSGLVHSQGLLFSIAPHDPAWQGRNLLDRPGSLLERHLAEGKDINVLQGLSAISRDQRLVALHTIRAPDIGVTMDPPLIVAVGRSVQALEAPWARQRLQALSGALLATIAACLGLALWERRQRLMNRLREQQHQLEREAAQRMALALDGADLGLWEWEPPSGRTLYDSRWCAMLGYEVRDLAPHVDSWQALLHPDDRAHVDEALQDCLQARTPRYTVEFRLRHREGEWIWIRANGRVVERDAQGQALRMVGTHLDITGSKLSEAMLLEQAQHTQAIVDNMVDGVITIDARGRIASFNPAASRMFGYAPEEVIGHNVSLLMPEPDASRHDSYIDNYMSGKTARVIGVGREVDGRRKSGSIFPMSLAVSRIERHGQPMFIGLTRDITERKRAEAAIERLAFYDPLTGLANRRLLLDRLNQALAASQRSGRHGAVLFIDLDNFKALNDTLGHGMGDRLLLSIAQRLQASLRAQDSVARWGGDEFVVLLQELGSERDPAALHAEAAAEKLLRVLGQPHQLDDVVHHSTPSIGIVLWGDEELSSEELLKRADHAMYQAKAAGRNRTCFFDPVTQTAMAERAALEADLRQALQQERFELHYQAQVNREGRVTGAEALLRWPHPERGWISPAVFIPLAEQTGLIGQLGDWVLDQACEKLRQWALDPALADLTLAVNVSAHQFRQKDFQARLQQQLSRSGAPAGRLKIELTESALVDDVEATISLMESLHRQGLSLSLDDFGTGYSSLAYLKRLPLNQLKIDRSFVRDLLSEPRDRAIARAIIQLGENLGLQVIAEGVETEDQRDVLQGLGCGAYQGYLFSRPLPLDQFLGLARRRGGAA